ncbi:response regulator transcription factor [Serratia quinivorans]|uniref:Response regulator transcription factor n=1 Tax=Serratia quinivorans TaxID=137545 RepID=A0ABV3URS1_9GAMM
MTRILQVLITDQDQFFAIGLKKLLTEHFHPKDITLRFLHHPMSYPLADLIFWASGHSNSMLPRGLLTDRYLSSRLFILTSGDNTPLMDRVLHRAFDRTKPCSVLLAMVEKAICKKPPSSQAEQVAVNNPMALLTPREKEVMYYLSWGLKVRNIANNMQVHEKTISSHKRAAMRKLQLKRTTDLHLWLLNNPMMQTPA